MTFVQPSGTVYPAGPLGGQFWGGYWAPVPHSISSQSSGVTLNAIASSYSTVNLSWTTPTTTFTGYAIVRNQVGWPNTLSEGSIIGSGNTTWLSTTDSVESGGVYYYSIFAQEPHATPQWVRVGTAMVTVPDNNAGGEALFERLPEWYQTLDDDSPQSDINGEGSYGQLRRFLELFGFQNDILRTEAETLAHLWDPTLIRADLLPYMAAMLGFPFEPNSGYDPVRRLMANWIDILQRKGTTEGIKEFAESVTGYQADVGLGVNMMWSTGDSNFAVTSHHKNNITAATVWQPDVTQLLGAGPSSNLFGYLATTAPAGLTVPDPNVAPLQGLKLLGNGSSAGYGVTCGDPLNVVATAIPVLPNTAYNFSAYFYANTAVITNHTITLSWFTAAGVLINTPSAGIPLVQNAWARAFIGQTSPANAAYAIPGFKATVASSNIYVTECQFQTGVGPTAWEPARWVKVTLYPNRVNYFKNPSFETTTTYATTSAGGSVVSHADNPGSARDSLFGSHSLFASLVGLVSNTANVNFSPGIGLAGTSAAFIVPALNVGDTATFSCFVKGNQPAFGEWMILQCSKYNTAGQSIGSATMVQPVYLGNLSYTPISFTAQVTAADFAAGIGQMTFTLTFQINNGVSAEYFIDAVLLERNNTPGVNSYFDGSSDTSAQQTDYTWSGTTNNSASMFYPNKYVRTQRLAALLPDFVPLNALTTLVYSLPIR